MTCRCGQPTRNNRHVCDTCADTLNQALGDTPWLADELETTLTRQKAATYDGGTPSAETPLPVHWGAATARDHLRGVLVSWVKYCDEEKIRHSSPHPGLPADTLVDMSRWLMWRVDGLTLTDIGPEAVDEVTSAVAHARRIVDRPAERWFAGPCDECEQDMYAVRGKGRVVCRGCGTSYDLEERRRWLLSQAEDHNATATEIARAVTVWAEYEPGQTRLVDKVRRWAAADRLPEKGHTLVRGHWRALYRVGDVLDLLHEERRDTYGKVG